MIIKDRDRQYESIERTKTSTIVILKDNPLTDFVQEQLVMICHKNHIIYKQ